MSATCGKQGDQGNRNVLDSEASRPHSGPTMQTAGLYPEAEDRGSLWSSDQPKIKDQFFHTEGSQPNTQPHQSLQKLGQASPISSKLPISFLVPHSYTEDQINMHKRASGRKQTADSRKQTNQSVDIFRDE